MTIIAAPAVVRVAHVPADHPYVRHLSPVLPDGVEVLPEPDPPGVPDGRWWPSQVLEPAWLRACAPTFDVVHVHFGFEHRTPEELREWVATLRELGKPLVLTVHDLVNPHLVDQTRHDANLDVLVPAASHVLTLTTGAAAEIARRWGRAATVVAHPHVVALDRFAIPRPRHEGVRVGLHAKARANSAPELVLPELRTAVARLGATLVPGPTSRVGDDALWDHISGLDVLVLAYRFATHSGFVEACFDLGTAVVAPRVGFLAEQRRVHTYDLGVPGSLTGALLRAAAGPAEAADVEVRLAERELVARAHRDVYLALVQGRSAA